MKYKPTRRRRMIVGHCNRKIGFVFQSFNLISNNVGFENVSPMHLRTRGISQAAAARAKELAVGAGERVRATCSNEMSEDSASVVIAR